MAWERCLDTVPLPRLHQVSSLSGFFLTVHRLPPVFVLPQVLASSRAQHETLHLPQREMLAAILSPRMVSEVTLAQYFGTQHKPKQKKGDLFCHALIRRVRWLCADESLEAGNFGRALKRTCERISHTTDEKQLFCFTIKGALANLVCWYYNLKW